MARLVFCGEVFVQELGKGVVEHVVPRRAEILLGQGPVAVVVLGFSIYRLGTLKQYALDPGGAGL